MSVRLFVCGIQETFETKMNKDGGITIPKINAEHINLEPLNPGMSAFYRLVALMLPTSINPISAINIDTGLMRL